MPKTKNQELETVDIKDRVIFSAGTWNGDTYTEDDIKAIAEAFNDLKGQLRPPLKLGHNEEQKLADGMPAIGWLDNVRAVGAKLMADFVKVPKKIYDLLKAGAYRTVSPEIYWNLEMNGKQYPYALKALALLGADIPACKDVSDIMALYSEVYAYSAEPGDVKAYTIETEDKEMEEKIKELEAKIAAYEAEKAQAATDKAALEAKVTENEAKVAEFTAKVEELTKTITEKDAVIAENTAKFAEIEKAKKYAALEARVDKMIADKKLLPANKDKALRLLSEIDLAKTYKEGGAEKSVEELVFDLIGTEVKMNTEAESGAGQKLSDDEEIKRIMQDKKCSYKEAYLVWKRGKANA